MLNRVLTNGEKERDVGKLNASVFGWIIGAWSRPKARCLIFSSVRRKVEFVEQSKIGPSPKIIAVLQREESSLLIRFFSATR